MMGRRICLVATALALASVIGCGKSSKADGPAGKVVSLEGEVSASRTDAEARTLAEGDVVYSDDLVRTTKDSEVVVRLDKNGAPLTLANGASKKVSESAAWNAPDSRSGTAIGGTDVTDHGAAAGRSGDHESGSHPSSTVANKGIKHEKPGTPAKVADQAKKNDGDKTLARNEDRAPDGVAAGAARTDDIAPSEDPLGELKGQGKGRGGAGGGPAKTGGDGAASMTEPSKNGTLSLRKVDPAVHRKVLSRAMDRREHSVGVCLVGNNDKLVFTAKIAIGADGAVTTVELVDKKALSADQVSCIERTFKYKYTPLDGGAKATVRATYK